MEPGSESSMRVSETKKTSWIPITPAAKPGFTEQPRQFELPQAGWINLQEFPPQIEGGYQANVSESGKFSVMFFANKSCLSFVNVFLIKK